MCLCIYYTFTFSNRTAFRRLDYKLSKLSDGLGKKCYPQGIIFIIKKPISYTPEERERLAYKELVTLVELDSIGTKHIHFSGWDEYKKMRARVGKKDVFGKLWVKIQ